MIHPLKLSGSNQQRRPVVKQEDLGKKWPWILPPIPVAFFSMQWNLTWADGFTSPPKEVVLRIFIAIKNLSSSAGLNPRTLGPMAILNVLNKLRFIKSATCCNLSTVSSLLFPPWYRLVLSMSITLCVAQYSAWLRTGRPGDSGSIPDGGKGLFR
jgi:hypothetical protein